MNRAKNKPLVKQGLAVRCDSFFPVCGEYDGIKDIEQIVNGPLQRIPYPTQLNKPNLVVWLDECGAYKPLPYNRWGIVGDFAIVKMSRDGRFMPMSDAEVEEVLYDLRDSNGYLAPECQVTVPFREPFKKFGEPPQGDVPKAGRWFS